jgi:hypothetical protein
MAPNELGPGPNEPKWVQNPGPMEANVPGTSSEKSIGPNAPAMGNLFIPVYRRWGGVQPGKRFVSLVRAYERSGCRMEFRLKCKGGSFPFSLSAREGLSLFPCESTVCSSELK